MYFKCMLRWDAKQSPYIAQVAQFLEHCSVEGKTWLMYGIVA